MKNETPQRDDEQMWELVLFSDGQEFKLPLMTRIDALQVRDIIIVKCGDMVSTGLSYGPDRSIGRNFLPTIDWSDEGR